MKRQAMLKLRLKTIASGNVHSQQTHQLLIVGSDDTLHGSDASTSLKLCDSAIYAFTMSIGYLLMLICMTFDPWMLLAIFIGYTVGHYFFSSRVLKLGNQQDLSCCSA